MNRRELIKKLFGGVAVATCTALAIRHEFPAITPVEGPFLVIEKPGMVIDVRTIEHICGGGSHLSTLEILKLWKDTGVLIYRSHPETVAPLVTKYAVIHYKYRREEDTVRFTGTRDRCEEWVEKYDTVPVDQRIKQYPLTYKEAYPSYKFVGSGVIHPKRGSIYHDPEKNAILVEKIT